MTRLLTLRLMPLVMVAVLVVCVASIGIGQTLPESWQVLFARQDVAGDWEIYNLDVTHGMFYKMYSDVMFPRMPQVSPDRRFVSYQDARGVLYIYDAETGHAHEIAYGDVPTWSPDSRQIAYPYNGYIRLVTLQDDGSFSDPQVIVNNHRNDVWSPVWSPDGRQLAFEIYQDSVRQVFVVESDGVNLRDFVGERATDYDPAWSPDGQYIAYASLVGGERDIYVSDVDGNYTELLTADLNNEYINDIRWSPTMTHLAFTSYRSDPPTIFILNRTTRNDVLGPFDTISVGTMGWSLDGQHLAYVQSDEGGSSINVVDIDGDSHQVLHTYGQVVILP